MQPPTNSPAGSPLTGACSKIAYVNSITPKVTQTGHFSFRFHGNLVNLIQQFTSDMMYIYWNSYKPKQLTSETTLKARDHLYSLVQQQNSFYLSIWQQSPDFTANDFDEKKIPIKKSKTQEFRASVLTTVCSLRLKYSHNQRNYKIIKYIFYLCKFYNWEHMLPLQYCWQTETQPCFIVFFSFGTSRLSYLSKGIKVIGATLPEVFIYIYQKGNG